MVSLFGLHHGEPAVVKSNSLLTMLKYNKDAIDSASQFTLVDSRIHDNSVKLHNNFGDTGKPTSGRGVRIKTIWMQEDATSLSCTTADFDPLEEGQHRYYSQMPVKSFEFAVRGTPCETIVQADVRSAMREHRWGVSKCNVSECCCCRCHTTDFSVSPDVYPDLVVKTMKLPSSLLSTLKCTNCTKCSKHIPPSQLVLNTIPSKSPSTIRFLIESSLRELLSSSFMFGYRGGMYEQITRYLNDNIVVEAFIIEQLEELSDRSTSLEELKGLFTSDRVLEGLKVVMSAVWVSPLRDCLTPARIGVSMAMGQVKSIRDENFKDIEKSACLADHFTGNSIVACAYIRSRDNGDPPCTSKPASIDPSMFDNILQLIRRGTLSGPAWTKRSVYGPIITKAFQLFHSLVIPNVEKLTDCSPSYRIRDFIKNHPSPLLLQKKDMEAIIKYCYHGASEKAVELGLATAIELGIDEESKRNILIGAEWFRRFDPCKNIHDSKFYPLPFHVGIQLFVWPFGGELTWFLTLRSVQAGLNELGMITLAAETVRKSLPETAKTQKNRAKKAKKLAKTLGKDEVEAVYFDPLD